MRAGKKYLENKDFLIYDKPSQTLALRNREKKVII